MDDIVKVFKDMNLEILKTHVLKIRAMPRRKFREDGFWTAKYDIVNDYDITLEEKPCECKCHSEYRNKAENCGTNPRGSDCDECKKEK